MEYVRQRKNHQIGLYSQKSYIIRMITSASPIENAAIFCDIICVHTGEREVCRRENLLSFVSNMDIGQQVYSFGQTGMNGGEMLCNVQ